MIKLSKIKVKENFKRSNGKNSLEETLIRQQWISEQRSLSQEKEDDTFDVLKEETGSQDYYTQKSFLSEIGVKRLFLTNSS